MREASKHRRKEAEGTLQNLRPEPWTTEPDEQIMMPEVVHTQTSLLSRLSVPAEYPKHKV